MWLYISFISFILAIFLHGLSIKLQMRIDSVRRFLCIGTVIGMNLFLISFLLFSLSSKFFASLAIYAFLCEIYIFIFTLVISSVSVSILIILENNSVQLTEIERLYQSGDMVKLRIQRLINVGYLVREGDNLFLSKRGERLVGKFSLLRKFFNHTSK
jgi:hypothetical protein